ADPARRLHRPDRRSPGRGPERRQRRRPRWAQGGGRTMNRTLLIARREYMAYAKTVGFWLSLLAFPLFGALGGAIPILMSHAEPTRSVALVDEAPTGSGLAAAVRQSLENEQAKGDINALRMAAIP